MDVTVPSLLRRERISTSPPEASVGPSLSQKLEEAQKKAQRAAMMAASLAARGGLVYKPPLGIDITDFQDRISIQDQTKLEESVHKILRNRSSIAGATAALGTSVDVRRIEALPPYNFIHSGGGGAGAVTSTPAPLPVIDTMLIPQQQQQQHIKTAMHQVPQQAPMKFPQDFRRGPRRKAPLKTWRLTPEHNTSSLIGKLIQVLVQSSKEWHPALVSGFNSVDGSALLVFESDIQRVVQLNTLIERNEVAWLNKETADEQNIGAGGAAGAGDRSGKKRRAVHMKASGPSTYQKISSLSSSVNGSDSIGLADAGHGDTIIRGGSGMSGGGFSGIGAHANNAAAAAGVPDTEETAATASDVERDEEHIVLERLKGVTKRQRAVAAKKIASAKTSPDSKALGTEGVRGVAGAVDRVGSRAEAAFLGNKHGLLQQQQTSLTHPPGFMPLHRHAPLLPLRKHGSMPMENAASYGAITQQHQHQQQQTILSNGSAGTASLLMPYIFQIGNELARGKFIQLTIQNISLPALVLKVYKETQSMLIVAQKRPVMLQAEDEGIKYKLAFIQKSDIDKMNGN